MNLSILN